MSKTKPIKFVRGVPYRDYRRVFQLVQARKLTWAQAEKRGLVGPCGKRGPKGKRAK